MNLAKQAIVILQDHIKEMGYQALIHFELEGCFEVSHISEQPNVDFSSVNQILKKLNVDGEIVAEYWQNQWEYVSKFNGQSPLKEADNLTFAIENLPLIFAKYGIEQTFIKPVVWHGDQGKLANNSDNIFTHDTRAVHIPNAIQINVSVLNQQNENIILNDFFGEYLQQCFMKTSLECCLLYLPEEDAFERLALKTRYGLAQELCSPVDISGGHQGSIALYKKVGKHNQKMGIEPLIVDQYNQTLVSEYNWQKTARIEHRLGASSIDYNAYYNVLYALINIVDALDIYQQGCCESQLKKLPLSVELPQSLYKNAQDEGAINLFSNSEWFNRRLNDIQKNSIKDKSKFSNFYALSSQINKVEKIGDTLKSDLLAKYENKITCQL